MSDRANDPDGGHDSREAGKGPTDIPEETVASESDLALSKEVADQERKQEQGEKRTRRPWPDESDG